MGSNSFNKYKPCEDGKHSPRTHLSTYHVLHVGSRRVNLASELVVKVQDELRVTVSDGPLPSLLGLPPVPFLVQVLVQNLLPASGVWKHHHGSGCLKQQQQGHAPQPVWRCMHSDSGDPLDLKQGWMQQGSQSEFRNSLLLLLLFPLRLQGKLEKKPKRESKTELLEELELVFRIKTAEY